MTVVLSKLRIVASFAAGLAASLLMCDNVPAHAANVGVAAAVNTDAKGRPPGGKPRVIAIGQNVVHNEEIVTDAVGLVQILLLDGTTFTVGPESRLVIDEFVYDPSTGDAKVIASVTKGAFRFIGGQTSRREGGATIKTPFGLIGVRGAMVEGNIILGCGLRDMVQSSKHSSCNLAPRSGLFSMIFGDQVRFTGPGGQKARIFKPGFTLEVHAADGSVETEVRRRTQDDASTFQTALAGTAGRSGGAKVKPNDAFVVQSSLGEVNSDLPNTAPIPQSRPSPVQSTDIADVENVAQINIVAAQQLNQEIVEQRRATLTTAGGRVLTTTADDVYVIDGTRFDGAGGRGLVGSTSSSDRQVGFLKQGGRLVSPEAGINLPDITGAAGDSGLEFVNVVDGTSTSGPISGPAYAGAGDFAAYLLGIGGDTTRPFYIITGTPTPPSAIDRMFVGSDVREYALTQDPIRPSVVPYFAQDLFGQFSTYNSSNLYLVESNTQSFHSGEPNFDTKIFQSWVIINGSGANQKSGIGVLASAFDRDMGGFATGRRGSFRYKATGGPANLRGDIRTLEGGSGVNSGSFFGPNAENFVLGTSVNPPDGYVDSLLGPGFTGNGSDGYVGDGTFSTHHVGGLVQTTSKSSSSRTSRSVDGFMSGVGESSADGINNPYVLSAAGLPNFTMDLDAQSNAMRAQANVFDVNDDSSVVANYLMTFGPIPGSSGGANAFVNDDVFGATHNDNNGNTRLRTDGGQDLANRTGDIPGSYIVSGRANPIPGFQHCTTCDFIDWGWWGTRVQVDASGSEVPGRRTDYVHMGTWVAGDITRPADLPNTINAAYDGTALGTVMRQTSAGTAKYIAKGDMNVSYDFNSRTGNLRISNFDGMTVAGPIADISTPTQALFAGGLSGTSGVTGLVQGAFVNNRTQKAGGVIGGFGFGNGSTVRVEGTIAGRRTR